MTDYTAPVEAAARVYAENTVGVNWDLVPPALKATVREGLLDIVVAAVNAARTDWEMENAIADVFGKE